MSFFVVTRGSPIAARSDAKSSLSQDLDFESGEYNMSSCELPQGCRDAGSASSDVIRSTPPHAARTTQTSAVARSRNLTVPCPTVNSQRKVMQRLRSKKAMPVVAKVEVSHTQQSMLELQSTSTSGSDQNASRAEHTTSWYQGGRIASSLMKSSTVHTYL